MTHHDIICNDSYNSIKGRSLNCKRDEVITKSIIQRMKSFCQGRKLHNTVILVLDDKYVLNEDSMTQKKITLPHGKTRLD